MRVVICDDRMDDANITKKSIEEYASERQIPVSISIINSGKSLLEYREAIDILFLDIELGGEPEDEDSDGINVMKKIVSRKNIWRIVFVSSHNERVFDSFGIKTLGFVVKPASKENIGKWIDIAQEELLEDNVLTLPSISRITIKENDIIYIKAEKNYCRFCCTEGEHIIYMNLSKLEDMLTAKKFIRVHKSYIVNASYVDDIKTVCTFINDAAELPVGRKYGTTSKDKLNDYVKNKILRRMG